MEFFAIVEALQVFLLAQAIEITPRDAADTGMAELLTKHARWVLTQKWLPLLPSQRPQPIRSQ